MATVTSEQIKKFINDVLKDDKLSDAQKIKTINDAADQAQVSRQEIAAATGYSLNDVNNYLGAPNVAKPLIDTVTPAITIKKREWDFTYATC